MNRRNTALGIALGVVLTATCYSLAAGKSIQATQIVFVVSITIFVFSIGLNLAANLLVASCFLTRWRLRIVGLNFLPEHFLIFLVALSLHKKKVVTTVARTCLAPLILATFLALQFASSISSSPNPSKSMSVVAWLTFSFFIMIGALAALRKGVDVYRLYITFSYVSAVASLLLGLVYLLGGPAVGVQYETNTGGVALAGVFFEANILGSTMAISLAMSFSSKHKIPKIQVVAMLLSLVLSLTRAAVLALLAALILNYIFKTFRSWSLSLRPGLALCVVVGILSATTVYPVILTKYSEAVDFGSGTGLQRIHTWETALKDIKTSDWLIGLGTNSFGQRHLEPTLPMKPTPAYIGNFPLQTLYDSGVAGILLLCLAFISIWPRPREARERAFILSIVFLITSSATSTFWFGSIWLLFALAIHSKERTHSESLVSELA